MSCGIKPQLNIENVGVCLNCVFTTPRDGRGACGGWVLGGQKFKSDKDAKRLDRLGPNLVHVCGFIWEWT